MKAIKPLPPEPVDKAARFALADAVAIQAIGKGTADPVQQKRALEWILRQASALGGQSFRPDPMQTAFHEGRRFVGNQIVGLLKLDTNKLKDDD